ncbi:MAG TPA: lipocalin family protein [Chitinophagaceae bacterium]|nr:lipocalin family protein [Chitinophagaceae bacterium]HMU58134.1 lipocalin family protein [Chitinophagaceae bacterium]
MQKQIFRFPLYISLLMLLITAACQKEDEEDTLTKTELIVSSGWKFDKATAGVYGDISAYIDACYKDNVITFSTGGTGTVNEATVVCAPSTAGSFTWSFTNNETTLNTSSALFPGGAGNFTIVSLNETNLVLSMPFTIPPPVSQTVVTEITLKH